MNYFSKEKTEKTLETKWNYRFSLPNIGKQKSMQTWKRNFSKEGKYKKKKEIFRTRYALEKRAMNAYFILIYQIISELKGLHN